MKWQVKAAAQHALSVLPAASRIETFGRRFVTRTTGLGDEQYRFRIEWSGGPYLQALRDQYGGQGLSLLSVYDAGCGWQPAVPFLLHAAGVGSQRLADVDRHLEPDGCRLVDTAMRRNERWLGELVPGGNLHLVEEQQQATLTPLLASRGIEYVCPESVVDAPLPTDSFDAAFCSGVLAYLRPDAVDSALTTLIRIVRPGGLIGLYVHLTDDFAGFDPAVGSFGFLRHDEPVWERLICSRRYYNNRLRVSDYVSAFRRHGLDTVDFRAEPPTTADLDQLAGLRVASRFAGRSLDDLGTRRFVAVLRVPSSRTAS